MTELEKALADIEAIKGQIARSAEFRGYGPATIALTGLLVILAAFIQWVWLPNPARDVGAYIAIWTVTAVIAAALVGIETVTRSRRLHSGLADEMIATAIGQFVPAIATGALLTFVLFRFAPQSLWMLPGLWQILFSLGIFASCSLLPKTLFAAGIWYLSCGLIVLAVSSGEWAFSPWAMAVPFGAGQLIFAALLYRALGGIDGEA